MSNRQTARFSSMSNAPTWKMADAPKGTLPLRQMTSRDGGYDPESVYVPAYGYEPFGSAVLHKKSTDIVQQFYSSGNQRLIVEAVLKYFSEHGGSQLSMENINATMVNTAMKKAFEVFGTSPDNAPHANVGPSESLTYESQAPALAYKEFNVDFVHLQNDELAKLNALSAVFLRENIVGERALLGRYREDLNGAIHVLEYPSRPPSNLRRGNQLDFTDYDDISRDMQFPVQSGIMGNRLSSSSSRAFTNAPLSNMQGNIVFPNRVVHSVKNGENVTHASPFGTLVGWSDSDAKTFSQQRNF